jgi:hypothetical protein
VLSLTPIRRCCACLLLPLLLLFVLGSRCSCRLLHFMLLTASELGCCCCVCAGVKAKREKLVGFGHHVYKNCDHHMYKEPLT